MRRQLYVNYQKAIFPYIEMENIQMMLNSHDKPENGLVYTKNGYNYSQSLK